MGTSSEMWAWVPAQGDVAIFLWLRGVATRLGWGSRVSLQAGPPIWPLTAGSLLQMLVWLVIAKWRGLRVVGIVLSKRSALLKPWFPWTV